MRHRRGLARASSTTAGPPRSRWATARATSTGLNLADGSVAPGWGSGRARRSGRARAATIPTRASAAPAVGDNGVEVAGSPPIDSTASVDPNNGDLYFGGGNAASPVDGGYYAYGPERQPGVEPGRDQPADRHRPRRRRAGLAVRRRRRLAGGGRLARPGDLRAEHRRTARRRPGGPSSPPTACSPPPPSATSTAPASDDFVAGGAQSAGFAYGTHYTDGGHVRIYNDHGGLICSATTNEEVDSSPAVGPILPGGAYGIATGTGSYFPGRQRREHGQGLRHQVQPGVERHPRRHHRRQPRAGRRAGQRPARRRRGHRDRATSGTRLRPERATGAVDLEHERQRRRRRLGHHGRPHRQRLPGRHRADRPRARTSSTARPARWWPHVDDGIGQRRGPRRERSIGFQNAPLVTADANGSIGITVAGYFAIGGQRRPGHRAALRGRRLRPAPGRRGGRLAPVPPRRRS